MIAVPVANHSSMIWFGSWVGAMVLMGVCDSITNAVANMSGVAVGVAEAVGVGVIVGVAVAVGDGVAVGVVV